MADPGKGAGGPKKFFWSPQPPPPPLLPLSLSRGLDPVLLVNFIHLDRETEFPRNIGKTKENKLLMVTLRNW